LILKNLSYFEEDIGKTAKNIRNTDILFVFGYTLKIFNAKKAKILEIELNIAYTIKNMLIMGGYALKDHLQKAGFCDVWTETTGMGKAY